MVGRDGAGGGGGPGRGHPSADARGHDGAWRPAGVGEGAADVPGDGLSGPFLTAAAAFVEAERDRIRRRGGGAQPKGGAAAASAAGCPTARVRGG